MSILVNKSTKILVQGITGREGGFHAEQMIAYGSQVVGGVTPGKGGQTAAGVPVFNSVKEAVSQTQANASVIFVPAKFGKDAILEAIDAGLKLVVCITEGIPIQDMIVVAAKAKEKGVTLIGPNCPGLATPGETKLGIAPGHIFKPGHVGIASRSGTLTYEIVYGLTQLGIGQSTCVGLGGDPILGTTFIDVFPMFEADDQTDVIVLVGEIGGNAEEAVAPLIENSKKTVIGFISGRTAPPGKRMGHAGAIISGGQGTAESKLKAWKKSGVLIADTTGEVISLVQKALKNKQSV